jgi:uncharacterized protein (TIGR02246 family)
MTPRRSYGQALPKSGSDAQKSAQAQPATDERPQDRAAIRATVDAFVKAFESRDPKSLASHWTSGGEYHNAAGATVRGRDTLEKAFTVLFAKTPEVKAEVHPESFRFLSRDSGVEEGTVTVRRGPVEPSTKARYRILFVREENRWRVAQLDESASDTVSVDELDWLVGDWKSVSGQGADILTSYTWAPNKKFIHAQFTVKEKGHTLTGNQVIGVDPATGNIRTWTFEADGGVGEASWNRDGDHWVLDAAGSLKDGRTVTETNILTRINADTFTWQSVDRHLGDKLIADLAPVKVVRVKSAK